MKSFIEIHNKIVELMDKARATEDELESEALCNQIDALL